MLKMLRCHICPVSYEVDRVLLPLLEMRADKAHLVTKAKRAGVDKAESILQRIERGAREEGIRTERRGCDITDFHDCIRVVGGLMDAEMKDGNLIFVNISSGGRVLSHASAVAGMMWGARLYYAQPEVDDRETREFTRGLKQVSEMPTFSIDRPGDDSLGILASVDDAGGRTTKKRLIAWLHEQRIIKPGTMSRQAEYQVLKRFLDSMVEKGWLEVKGETRSSRVLLTKDGSLILKAFGRH